MDSWKLSMEDVATRCKGAGFEPVLIPMVVSIIWGESGGDAYAVNVNDQDATKPSYLSLDVGLVQFNTYWNLEHPSLTPESRVTIPQMIDPDQALAVMAKVTDGGRKNLRRWNVYVNEGWQVHYPAAYAACVAAGVLA